MFDNQKHYFVGDDELEKLLAKGTGWLATHPEKEQITRRYLRHQSSLFREALARLAEEEAADADDERLAGFDAAAVVEVIEHLDPPRLSALERVLFEFARPKTIVVTRASASESAA